MIRNYPLNDLREEIKEQSNLLVAYLRLLQAFKWSYQTKSLNFKSLV